MADGVLEAGLVGEEDGVARQDPVVDFGQLHPLVRAAHDGGHDQVLVRHLKKIINFFTQKKVLQIFTIFICSFHHFHFKRSKMSSMTQ